MENNNGSDRSSEGTDSSDTLFGSSTDPDSLLFEPHGSVEARLAAFELAFPPAPTFVPGSAAASTSHSAAASATSDPGSWEARLASLRAFAASAGASTSRSAAAPGQSDSSDEDAAAAMKALHVGASGGGIIIGSAVPSSSAGPSTQAHGEALAVPPASPEVNQATVCSCSNTSDSTLSRLSPMQLAARNGCQLCLEQLVKVPQNDPIAEDVHSPLCLAIEGRYLECVKILLQADDAEALHQLSLEWSPLQVAASTGCVEIISFLLERGADAQVATPKHPLAPVFIAASNGFLAAVEVLLPHTPKDLPLEPWNAQGLLKHYGWSDDVPSDDAD